MSIATITRLSTDKDLRSVHRTGNHPLPARRSRYRGLPLVAPILAACFSPLACADGVVVDRVYDPYVQPLESEIEWRAVSLHDDEDDDLDSMQLYRLGIGHSFSDSWAGEVYLLGERNGDQSLAIEAVELESKWQLTEQGEYAADWGLLFELEKERSDNQWEAAGSVLAAKDWGRWSGIANLAAIYEWGDKLNDELESELKLQGRYRLSRAFEPALELYAGQDSIGIGPVARGTLRLEGARQLLWEFGLIRGVTEESPDTAVRMLLEYEFY